MKREDIDKRIGMPDVDGEWAKFEREVIATSGKPRSRHTATWVVGIGIAAVILLLFVLNTDMEKTTEMPLKAGQVALNSHQDDTPTNHQDDIVVRLGSTEADTQIIPDMQARIAGKDLPQRTENQVSDVKVIGSDSVGTLKFLTNYSQGKELAEHLLIPVDSASESWQERHKRMAFYDKIRTRLMMWPSA